MALRCLASKFGIPALPRASAPRVSPSAGASPPVTSSSFQGGRTNGGGVGRARKQPSDADIEKIQAEFAAECEAFKKAIDDQNKNTRLVIWSGAAGLGLALITIGHAVYEEKKRARSFRFG